MNARSRRLHRGKSGGAALLLAAALVMAIAPAGTAGKALQTPQESPIQVIDYKIGSKDLLEVKVFELPELNQTVRVSEDGSISLALLGKVDVAGLTAQELEKKLAEILDAKYTKGAHVSVFIKEYQKVSVLGAVGKPGMYELVGPTTLLQIISQAGGLTNQAMNELFIYRQGKNGQKNRIAINMDDLVLKGNPSANIDLQANDVINVPIDQTQTVHVMGEVKTPGAIQFKLSKKITLLAAIAQAGGTTEWAATSRIIVKKKDKETGQEMRLVVDLKSIINGRKPDIILEEGDIVIVP